MGMNGTGQGPRGEQQSQEHEAPQDWFAFTARRLVAAAFGVAETEMRRTSRGERDIAFARQVAMYMAHTTYQLSFQEVADAFGRERTTVAHACQVVEDARDDADLDEKLDKITSRMEGLARIVFGRPTALVTQVPPIPRLMM